MQFIHNTTWPHFTGTSAGYDRKREECDDTEFCDRLYIGKCAQIQIGESMQNTSRQRQHYGRVCSVQTIELNSSTNKSGWWHLLAYISGLFRFHRFRSFELKAAWRPAQCMLEYGRYAADLLNTKMCGESCLKLPNITNIKGLIMCNFS